MRVTVRIVRILGAVGITGGWPQQRTYYPCSEEAGFETLTRDAGKSCNGRYHEVNGAPLLARYETVLSGINLERALAPADNSSRNSKLRGVANILKLGRPVNIAVIGGSVTYGIGCEDAMNRTLMRCAWPGRLGRSLCALFSASEVRVLDLTMPASSMHMWLSRSSEFFGRETEPIDLYIIDYGINGGGSAEELVTLVHILRQRTEGNAAILFLETVGHFGRKVPKGWRRTTQKQWLNSNRHTGILASLVIPWVSYRDAIWPVLPRGPERSCFYEGNLTDIPTIDPKYGGYVCWDGKVHPTWRVHQLMADIISTLFLRLARFDSCRISTAAPPIVPFQPTPPPPRWICAVPLTTLSSNNKASFVASHVGVGWSFYEDVKGKPGWIGNTSGTTISFDVKISPAPMLTVTYLRSYDTPKVHMAHVVVTLICASNVSTVAILNGSWTDDVSLEVSHNWKPRKYPVTQASNMVSPCRVDITLLGPLLRHTPIKFKLTGLLSC